MGYEDRLNGPMEKPLADYVSTDKGGDIPEHRIAYVRYGDAVTGRAGRAVDVLWDRVGGRVDRLFGSGQGASAAVAATTLDGMAAAHVTMKRVAAEKLALLQEKMR